MHRTVVGRFDGGKFSSDAGGLLLRKGEQRCHILKRLAECFIYHQNFQVSIVSSDYETAFMYVSVSILPQA